MTLDEVTKAQDLVSDLNHAAEKLVQARNAKDCYNILYLVDSGSPDHIRLLAEMQKVAVAHQTAKIEALKVSLGELGVFPTDAEIIERAEKAEADREERMAKWEAERKAKEASESQRKPTAVMS